MFSDDKVFVSDRASRLRTKGREKGLQRISNKKRKKTPIALKAEGLFLRMTMCEFLFLFLGDKRGMKKVG